MKSDVSDHLEIVQAVYIDACAKCIADVSDLRDLNTIRSRVKDEGLSFLTITLPEFCRDFERSLATGCIDSSQFRMFRKSGSIPAFLQGMISLIFDRETGRIYDESSIYYNDHPILVDSVRQICLTFKKMELDCTQERVQAAITNFTAIEHELQSFSASEEDIQEFSRVSSVLWDNLVHSLCYDKLLPRHGPGATAERISGNQKYHWRYWYERLELYFPIVDRGYSISVHDAKELEEVTFVPELSELPVRVVTVPKTLKAPRIIAIEPVCMQYTQQAVRGLLQEAIEHDDCTKGHVNFRDQSVNQRLAMISSSRGHLATVDLSDASDRVSRDLALVMFRANPDIQDLIDACRSTSAILPSGEIISPLRKFASMGSALCFPIESMYFYTICVAALLKVKNLPVTFANCFAVSRDVHVYGDDIVIPVAYAKTVLEYLQKYNCKVNPNKTFVSGCFRESCGVDAFRGELVTPTYLRRERPKNRRQVQRLISWVATANLFYKRGYWRTAQLLWKSVERIIGPLPYVSENSSALGRISYLGYRSVGRWNRKLQRFEIKALVPSPVYRTDKLEGYAALAKCLLRLEAGKASLVESDPFVVTLKRLMGENTRPIVDLDVKHLERSALYGAVALKLRWVPSEI